MRALEIIVNGRRVCLARLPVERMLSVALNFLGESSIPGGPSSATYSGGMGVGGREGDDLLSWKCPHLAPGDEITLRVVETDDTEDQPTRQHIASPSI